MKNSECFFSFEEAQNKIEYWCGYRDRSVHETIQKLISYGQPEKDIVRIISHLKELNFLDDERFANSFVSGKFRMKQWGRKKIYAHILQKRVDKSFIQKALYQIDGQEYQNTIEHLVEKKLRLLSNEKDPWKKKQKVLQYLISRGFEYELIQEVISKKQQ